MTLLATLKNIPLYLDKVEQGLRIAQLNWQKIDATLNFGTALLLKRAANNTHFFNKLARSQGFLTKLHFISLVSNVIFLGAKIEETWGIVAILKPLPHMIALTAVGMPVCLTFVSLKIVHLVNKIALRSLTVNETSYPFTRPKREIYSQIFYTARLLTQIATIYFAPTNPFFIFSAACELYSLLKITQRKWVEFKHEGVIQLKKNKEIRERGEIPTMPLSSTIFALAKTRILARSKTVEPCGICEKRDLPRDVSLCGKHFFHINCLFQNIQAKVDDFPTKIQENEQYIQRELCHDGTFRGSQLVDLELEASYAISMPKESVPACPTCSLQPEWNEFSALISDSLFGTTPLELEFQ